MPYAICMLPRVEASPSPMPNPAVSTYSNSSSNLPHTRARAVAGVALQVALDLNRVYVEAAGTFLTDSAQCGKSKTLDSCYFLPFSKCKPTAAQLRDAPQLVSSRRKGQEDK